MTNTLEAYYTKGKKIGEGAFGEVFEGKRKRDGLPVAIKFVDMEDMTPEEQNDTLHEVMVMCQIGNCHCVRFCDAFLQGSFVIICMEYVDGGDLGDVIKDAKEEEVYISEDEIWEYAAQMCLGLKYLHDRRIVHRDLKPQNVMLDEEGNIKIADFGFGKLLGAACFFRSNVGSPLYHAPELLSGKGGNEKADVWPFGCILYELATLEHAFDARTEPELYKKILEKTPAPLPSYYSKELSDFIFSILIVDPEKRPSINQLLNFPKLRKVLSEMDALNPLDDEESCIWQEMTEMLGDDNTIASQLSWLVHEFAKVRVDAEAAETAKSEKPDAKPEEILGLSRRSSSKIRVLMEEIEEERERLRAKEAELLKREQEIEKLVQKICDESSGSKSGSNDDKEKTDVPSDDKVAPAAPKSPLKKGHKKEELSPVPFELSSSPTPATPAKLSICKNNGYIMIPSSHLKLMPVIPATESLKCVYAWHKQGKNTGDLPRDFFAVTPTWVNSDSRLFSKPCKHMTFLFRVKVETTTTMSARAFYLKSAYATIGGTTSDKIVFKPEDTVPVSGVTADGNTQWLYVRYTNDDDISQMRLEVESASLLEEFVILYGTKVSKSF